MQVEQDGRWWCEGDGCYVDTPEHRYMMTIRLADLTGEAYVTVFNEQVRKESSGSKGGAGAKSVVLQQSSCKKVHRKGNVQGGRPDGGGIRDGVQ
jgi:hypothetical protein